jgi:hypothetical protein
MSKISSLARQMMAQEHEQAESNLTFNISHGRTDDFTT